MLFTLASGGDFDRWDRARIVVQSLTSETPTTLFEGGSDARYDPAAGSLVYVDTQSLLARPFDARQRTLTGGAVPLAGLVQRSSGRNTGAASFSVSGSSLAYIAGSVLSLSATGIEFEVRLTDPNGAVERLKLPPARYSAPRVSPDGTHLALGVQEGNQARIAVYELSGASALRPLPLKGNNRYPIWSHDSQRLTFQSDADGDLALFQIPVNGGAMERLTTPGPGEIHEPESGPRQARRCFSAWRRRAATSRCGHIRCRIAEWPASAMCTRMFLPAYDSRVMEAGSLIQYGRATRPESTWNRSRRQVKGTNCRLAAQMFRRTRSAGRQRATSCLRSQDSRVRGRLVRDPPDVQVW